MYGIECAAPSISPRWLNTTLAIDPDRLYAYKAVGPWTYICYPGIKYHRKKLYPVSTGGIVGISVGIGIPLLLFIVWFVHRRGNKKIALEVEKRRQARLAGRFSGDGEDGHELQERGHREALPICKAEGDGVVVESASTEGGDSAVRGVAGGLRPLGYHEPHKGSGFVRYG